MNQKNVFCPVAALVAISMVLLAVGCANPERAERNAKPVLLYSQYFNAEGENRYPADGNYSEILRHLGNEFEIRVHRQPLTSATLADVDVVLIANANDMAVPGFPPPPHVSGSDIKTLTRYVENGGGLIVTQNQENHNVEVADMNKLLARFGLQTTNRYTDAKLVSIPDHAPILGGLKWAYIIGNSIEIEPSHPAKPRAIVRNDLNQKLAGGTRDEPGILMAGAEPGNGRVVVITDSGWITNAALNGEEAGGVVIKDQDNREIMRRLTRWAAGMDPVP